MNTNTTKESGRYTGPKPIVEKGVAIPSDLMGRHGLLKFPFNEMKEVGDSFAIPTTSKSIYRNLSGCALSYARRHGIRFTVRKLDREIRCWRVEVEA